MSGYSEGILEVKNQLQKENGIDFYLCFIFNENGN